MPKVGKKAEEVNQTRNVKRSERDCRGKGFGAPRERKKKPAQRKKEHLKKVRPGKEQVKTKRKLWTASTVGGGQVR